MITGKTSTGFEYEIKETALSNYELLEVLRKIDKGNAGYLVDAVDMLLEEKQKMALKDHVRDEDGKVSVEKMFKEISEIFQNEKEIKN